jgi:DeoR family transcriptional regulator of aga operon
MMTQSERHQYITRQLEKKGFVRVLELAEQLGVSGATIRKDLRIMESQHLLYRNHGSASLITPKVVDLPVREKSKINSELKLKIAKAADALIAQDDSIILTSGSTIEALALNMSSHGNLNVVTPSIRVGVYLSEKDNVSILMLGGRLIPNSLSVRDEYSTEGLKHVNCNKMFCSCDGFDIEVGVTTATVEEARITASMMDAASEVILLVDSTKIGKSTYGKICDVNRIDTVITDSGIQQSVVDRLEDAGIQVVIVG